MITQSSIPHIHHTETEALIEKTLAHPAATAEVNLKRREQQTPHPSNIHHIRPKRESFCSRFGAHVRILFKSRISIALSVKYLTLEARRLYTSTNAEMIVQSWDWSGVVPWT